VLANSLIARRARGTGVYLPEILARDPAGGLENPRRAGMPLYIEG